MVEVIRTFEVPGSPEQVLEYLKDFARAEEWDPGTVHCTRLDRGPIQIGTQWRNVSEFMGNQTELVYELTRLEHDRITFAGKNDSADSTDDITLVPGSETGTTEVTYHATIILRGLAKVATPLAKVEFERLGDKTAASMTEALGRAQTTG